MEEMEREMAIPMDDLGNPIPPKDYGVIVAENVAKFNQEQGDAYQRCAVADVKKSKSLKMNRIRPCRISFEWKKQGEDECDSQKLFSNSEGRVDRCIVCGVNSNYQCKQSAVLESPDHALPEYISFIAVAQKPMELFKCKVTLIIIAYSYTIK
uniref:Uncharacterized protein n=1 Tax=Romanomermis culicivorax TaxID=13658 RepID=A0A915KD63_ROMCU